MLVSGDRLLQVAKEHHFAIRPSMRGQTTFHGNIREGRRTAGTLYYGYSSY